MREEFAAGARNAVRNCLNVGERDRVAVIKDRVSEDISQSIEEEARATGAEVRSWAMEDHLRRAGRAALGFMPEDEGLALYEAGLAAGRLGPLLEIGSYCGKSALYLGAEARAAGTVLFSVDHHRGS